MVFLGKRVEVSARRGYGRLVIGTWVHVGDDNRLRCHEGSLRIGDKCVFGRDNSVNCYLDIEIGPATIVSDWVYICDFDHVYDRPHPADQGPGDRQVAGPDRRRQLARHQGHRAAGRGDRPRLGRGGALRRARQAPELSVLAGIPARVVRRRQPGTQEDLGETRRLGAGRRSRR